MLLFRLTLEWILLNLEDNYILNDMEILFLFEGHLISIDRAEEPAVKQIVIPL